MNNTPRSRWGLFSLCLIILAGCAPRQGLQSRPAPPAPTPKPDSFLDAIASVKHSIAPVVCVQTRPSGDWELRSIEGTAFFVSSDGSFVTPNHVLDGLTAQNRRIPCPTAALYIPEDGVWHVDRASFRIHYATFLIQLCKRDTRLDLAYCPIFTNGLTLTNGTKLEITPVEFDMNPPPDGSPAAFTGFPLSNVAPISAVGFVAGYRGTDDLGTFDIIVDRSTWPGASGSPIYLQNGRVIGIVLARGVGDATGLTYGRVSRFVREVLPKTAEKENQE